MADCLMTLRAPDERNRFFGPKETAFVADIWYHPRCFHCLDENANRFFCAKAAATLEKIDGGTGTRLIRDDRSLVAAHVELLGSL